MHDFTTKTEQLKHKGIKNIFLVLYVLNGDAFGIDFLLSDDIESTPLHIQELNHSKYKKETFFI